MPDQTLSTYGITPIDDDDLHRVAGGVRDGGGGSSTGAAVKLVIRLIANFIKNDDGMPEDHSDTFHQPEGSSFPGGGGGSDIRIKEDIKVVGRHDGLGLDIYSWTYKHRDPTRYVGVMAQDILEKPDLAHTVFTADEGDFKDFYAVDYHALGLKMATEAEWNARGQSAISAPVANRA